MTPEPVSTVAVAAHAKVNPLLRVRAVLAEAAPGARVVVLSGRDAEAAAGRALALGAQRYVLKPAGLEAIRTAILHAAT